MNRTQYIQMFRALERTRTRYTECIRITRIDGTVFRFTAHDEALTVTESDGSKQVYTSAHSFSLTALEVSNGLAVSNMDIDGIIDDDSITEADLFNGLFDNARVDIFIAYWANSRIQTLPLRASWIGQLSVEGIKFKADLRGIANRLAQVFISSTQLDCRFRLGDSKCGVSLTPGGAYVSDLAVTTVHSAGDEFSMSGIPVAQFLNFYQWGYIEWLTGNNSGAFMEIHRQFGPRIKLFLPMSAAIEVGDTGRLVAGCDKTFKTCCDKFDNTRRFGGEPFLTGSDLLTTTPDFGGDSGEDME